MNDFFRESMFAGVTLSLVAYLIGTLLKKKFKLGIFNPLLISIVVSIVVLVVGKVDYYTYNEGAKYLSWLLTPATVCLAIPLYEQWGLLLKNFKAVMLGLVAGTITSLTTVLALALICGLSHEEYVTLLPKIHNNSHRNGCIGGVGRICNHNCSCNNYYRCIGKYFWRINLQNI